MALFKDSLARIKPQGCDEINPSSPIQVEESTPKEVGETPQSDISLVDGASEFALYRRIILPMLQPISLSAWIVLGHISFNIFDLVHTMTGRGPGFVTDVPGIFVFETTFQGNHYAQGAAISMIMLLMVALVIIPYLIFSLRQEVEL